jgi:ribosome maturation factor RimP
MPGASVKELTQMLEPALITLGYELVGCELFHQGRHSLLRVYIDSPQGITIDDCERASRQISVLLDVEDPMVGAYNLEVSSPGSERPLFTEAHYQRFIGSRVHIRLRRPQEGRRNFAGILQKVESGKVTVEVDEVGFVFAILEIEKANLEP